MADVVDSCCCSIGEVTGAPAAPAAVADDLCEEDMVAGADVAADGGGAWPELCRAQQWKSHSVEVGEPLWNFEEYNILADM